MLKSYNNQSRHKTNQDITLYATRLYTKWQNTPHRITFLGAFQQNAPLESAKPSLEFLHPGGHFGKQQPRFGKMSPSLDSLLQISQIMLPSII